MRDTGFKYNPQTLKKLEELFEEARYIIRFEKGHFNSGYCILESRRVVVINKFFNVEGRINAMLEILQELVIDEETLSGDMQRWYRQLKERPDFNAAPAVQTQMKLS
ncbi:MAG: hypothetical protein EBZ77_03760 [Chitinophagia bacterium]|nr:hypothetical protein [Chitinophagia bacterium]